MRGLGWLVGVIVAVALFCTPALAEKRVALVIGNAAYAHGGVLRNPLNDAADISAKLKWLGFEVIVGRDLTRAQMLDRLREFRTKLEDADVALLYYAGHGMQVGGQNVLIPTDAQLKDELDLDAQTLRLDTIVAEMERRPRINLVFIDACRDNPLAERLSRSLRATGRGNVGLAQGLAEIKTQAVDTLVMYAAAPGQVADDGTGRNSPFTSALLKHIDMREEISVMLKGVIGDVRAATQGKQRPQQLASMERRFYLAGLPAAVGAGDPAALKAEQDVRRRLETQLAERDIAFKREQADTQARLKSLEQQLAANAAQPRVIAPPVQVPIPARPTDPVAALVPGSGKFARDCPTCPEMVVAPSGEFMMGSTPEEIDAVTKELPSDPVRFKREGPRHKVSIERPFAVGRTHITRGEFAAFVTATGHKTDGGCRIFDGKEWKLDAARSWRSPGFDQTDAHPVVCVSWNDATAYAAWLSKTSDKVYRLLSEAEAEYVARATMQATSQPRFFFGNDYKDLCTHGNGADRTSAAKLNWGPKTLDWGQKTIAPCDDGFVHTAPVASYKANAWGLHDVHGNAWTWTADCFADSYAGAPSDGSARTTGECVSRVRRGGSWIDFPQNRRAAYRGGIPPDSRDSDIGFRLARTLIPTP